MSASRDKGTSRRRFAEHSVPSAGSTRVHSADEAARAAAKTGYPVVLKPAANAASLGVVRADTAEELRERWTFAVRGTQTQGPEGTGILVEEFLDGPEVSVECATQAGVTTALAVTRKDVGFPPYFEEVGHAVSADDPLLPALAPIATQAIAALGISDGVQHVEMRLTADGPRIIEVNSRIGGDLIGVLVQLATGLDLPRIAADIACGARPDLASTVRATAAVQIVYSPADGVLAARGLPALARAERPWLIRLDWLRSAGDRVALPPEGDAFIARVGMFVITADTPEQARNRVADVCDQLVISVVEPDA